MMAFAEQPEDSQGEDEQLATPILDRNGIDDAKREQRQVIRAMQSDLPMLERAYKIGLQIGNRAAADTARGIMLTQMDKLNRIATDTPTPQGEGGVTEKEAMMAMSLIIRYQEVNGRLAIEDRKWESEQPQTGREQQIVVFSAQPAMDAETGEPLDTDFEEKAQGYREQLNKQKEEQEGETDAQASN